MATHRVWVGQPGLEGESSPGHSSQLSISTKPFHSWINYEASPLRSSTNNSRKSKILAFVGIKDQQTQVYATEISKQAYTHTAITSLASFMRDHHHLHPFTQMLLQEQEKHWVCFLDCLNSLNNVVYSTIICYSLEPFEKRSFKKKQKKTGTVDGNFLQRKKLVLSTLTR